MKNPYDTDENETRIRTNVIPDGLITIVESQNGVYGISRCFVQHAQYIHKK